MSEKADTPTAAAQKTEHGADKFIWGSYICLVIFSIIELFSASSQQVRVNDIFKPLISHVVYLVAGFGLMLILQRTHYTRIIRVIPIYVIGSIALMCFVLLCGTKVNGELRAIEIFGVMIVPAEFLKLAVALGIALVLSRYRTRENGQNDVASGGVVISAALVGISSALLFNQGLTNTLLLMGISIGMMIIGGISWRKLGVVLMVYMAFGGIAVAYKMISASSHEATAEEIELARINQEDVKTNDADNRAFTWKGRFARHLVWDKWKEPVDDGNKQAQLSFMAQARGGLVGQGIGKSRENARLPLAFSDYIFAIIVEELGAVVACIVILLYLFLLGRAGRLAMTVKSSPACLLVIGCALVICLQALFHVAIVVGVFPVSGQPLPLISKGGISILATSLALGIMLSVSKWAARTNDDEDAFRHELSSLPENLATDNPSQI